MPTKNNQTKFLTLALQEIMTAAKTPRNLLFFMVNMTTTLHALRCRELDEEEEDSRILPENDHVFACLFFIQDIVFYWHDPAASAPNINMIEGMDGLMKHFGVGGWKDLCSQLTVATAKDATGGDWGFAGNLEMFSIFVAFHKAAPYLEQYAAAERHSLKAA